ncbi:MAG: hypothetical protein LBT06_05070, partial [Hungatella sp.]|nr:hypothetical protein [Hungatella sp.]
LLSEGDIKIPCMYERVNINCAEVNSTWVSGGGIYFFNFQVTIDCKLDMEYPQEVCYTNFVYVSATPS